MVEVLSLLSPPPPPLSLYHSKTRIMHAPHPQRWDWTQGGKTCAIPMFDITSHGIPRRTFCHDISQDWIKYRIIFPLSNQLRVISKFQFQNFLINSKVFVTSLIKIGEKYLLNLFSEDDIKHARHVYDIYRSYQRYKIIPLLRIWTIYGLVARW